MATETGTLPRLFRVCEVPAWLAARGIVSHKTGKPLRPGAIWYWISTKRLRPVPGLAITHVSEEELERLISTPPEDEAAAVKRSRRKSPATQARERQEQREKNRAARASMGVNY